MVSRSNLKSLIDQLPESSLEHVETFLRFCVSQHAGEQRLGVTEEETPPVGRSSWSNVSAGVHVSAQSFHRVQGRELLVQTLYNVEGQEVEVVEAIAIPLNGSKLSFQVTISSAAITVKHANEFPAQYERRRPNP
jgi:hypothetical protein